MHSEEIGKLWTVLQKKNNGPSNHLHEGELIGVLNETQTESTIKKNEQDQSTSSLNLAPAIKIMTVIAFTPVTISTEG